MTDLPSLKERIETAERWITQTVTHTEDGPPGNCVQAALASLLHVPLEDVPHFVADHGTKWEIYFNKWLEARGWEVHRFGGNYRPDGLYLASGPSPRGVRHMVVMQDRELIHDPHPSRAGLLEVDEVRILVPLDPAALIAGLKAACADVAERFAQAAADDPEPSNLDINYGRVDAGESIRDAILSTPLPALTQSHGDENV